MTVFLDTSFLQAFYHSADKNHEKAAATASQIKNLEFGAQIISDYVFDELVTIFLARSNNAEKAIEIGETILGSDIEFMRLNSETFSNAWNLFKKRKNISFTDCTIIALMKEHGIKYLATFDSGFKQFSGEIKILPE